MLTIQERSLADIRQDLPNVYHKSCSIRCPWKVKGSLMRHLLETHSPENLELIDGVKIISLQNDNWVLILPDAGEPLVHIYANSSDRFWVDEQLLAYRQRVQNFIDQEQSY